MTERQIHDQFSRWLTDRHIPFVHHRMDRKSGISKGWPNYTVCFMSRVTMIEIKAEKGRLRPNQVRMIEYIRRSGNTVEVARSLPEAIEAVQSILCEGKPAVGEYGACNYPLEPCFRTLKEAVRTVPDNGSKDLGGQGSRTALSNEPGGAAEDKSQATDSSRQLPALRFFVGQWGGAWYVFAPDLDGNYRMIREATALDLQNFPRSEPDPEVQSFETRRN